MPRLESLAAEGGDTLTREEERTLDQSVMAFSDRVRERERGQRRKAKRNNGSKRGKTKKTNPSPLQE